MYPQNESHLATVISLKSQVDISCVQWGRWWCWGGGGGAHSTGRGLLYNRGTKTIYGKYLCSSSNHQEQIVGEAESTRKFPTEFWISVSARPWLADCPLSSLLTDVLMYCVCAWPPCKECQYHPLVIRGTGTSRQMRISTTPWQHQTIPSPATHTTRQYPPLHPHHRTIPSPHTKPKILTPALSLRGNTNSTRNWNP